MDHRLALDVDARGAATVADEITAAGCKAVAVTADMSREADGQAPVARAPEAVGRVDVFCSNARIIVGGRGGGGWWRAGGRARGGSGARWGRAPGAGTVH